MKPTAYGLFSAVARKSVAVISVSLPSLWLPCILRQQEFESDSLKRQKVQLSTISTVQWPVLLRLFLACLFLSLFRFLRPVIIMQ